MKEQILDTFKIAVQVSERKNGRNINPKVYHMEVQHIYSSEQVERFRILGKDRSMMMEKRLVGKTRQWKIVDAPREIGLSQIEAHASAILQMQNAIDRYLDDRAGKNINIYNEWLKK